MSIDHVIRNLAGYEDTFHFEGELRALNRLADGVTQGVIVAIGSYRGQADCALALHAHVPVFAVDPRRGWVSEPRDFNDQDRVFWYANVNSLGLVAKIKPIELPSLDVAKIWTEPIGLLWVDGNHVEVAADLAAWLPFVIDGGLIAVHDNNAPSIIAAVTARDDMVEIERADLTTVYRKESLYEPFTYDGLTMLVSKGPYNKDDRYVLGEVRSYDIGTDPVRTCLDIGGHIGAFSRWIASLNPAADIVAVEPELSRYTLLARNCPPGSNIKALNARVNYTADDLALYVDPVNSGSHRLLRRQDVREGLSVVTPPEAVTIEQIMQVQGWDTIDLLKIDCESCEVDVLMNAPDETLRVVKRIVGEFHDGYDNFMAGIGARLQGLGFDVTGTQNPLAHATFVAINRFWIPTEIVVDTAEKSTLKVLRDTRKPKGKGR